MWWFGFGRGTIWELVVCAPVVASWGSIVGVMIGVGADAGIVLHTVYPKMKQCLYLALAAVAHFADNRLFVCRFDV